MKGRKQIPATLLAIVTAFSLVGYVPAYADAEAYAAEHIHDETCGYSEGSPCTHTIHDETCGYMEAAAGPSCKHELGQHDETCGYAAATPCTDQASPAELGTLLDAGFSVGAAISGAACTVSSEVANTEQDVITWLQEFWLPEIPGLQDALDNIDDLKVVPDPSVPTPFVAAQAGVNGQYSFLIQTGSGDSAATLGQKTCTITASADTPPSLVKEAPEITASGGTADPVTGVITAAKGSAVTLTASLSSNVAEHSLQWQKKAADDSGFLVIPDSDNPTLQVIIDNNFVETQYRCAAVYADEALPSNVLTIRAEEEAAYTVSIAADGGSLLKGDRISVKLTASIKETASGQPYTGSAGYAWSLSGEDSSYFSMGAADQKEMTLTTNGGTRGKHKVYVDLIVTIGDLEIPASLTITREEADKSELQKAVDEAQTLLSTTVASEDGSDVDVDKYWGDSEYLKTLKKETRDGQGYMDRWNASEQHVGDQTRNLREAIALVKGNRRPGTNGGINLVTENRNVIAYVSTPPKIDKDNLKEDHSKDSTVVKKDGNTIIFNPAETPYIISDGVAQNTTKINKNDVLKAANGATKENPYKLSISLQGSKAAEQLKNANVKKVKLNVVIPETVAQSQTVTLNEITLDPNVLEAAKETGKDLTVAVQDEKGNPAYSITVSGKKMQGLDFTITQMNFAADVTESEGKTVIDLKQTGFIPGIEAEVEIPYTPSEKEINGTDKLQEEGWAETNKPLPFIPEKENNGSKSDEPAWTEADTRQWYGLALKSINETELPVYKETEDGFYQAMGTAKLSASGKASFLVGQGGKYEVRDSVPEKIYPVKSNDTLPVPVKKGQEYTFKFQVSDLDKTAQDADSYKGVSPLYDKKGELLYSGKFPKDPIIYEKSGTVQDKDLYDGAGKLFLSKDGYLLYAGEFSEGKEKECTYAVIADGNPGDTKEIYSSVLGGPPVLIATAVVTG